MRMYFPFWMQNRLDDWQSPASGVKSLVKMSVQKRKSFVAEGNGFTGKEGNDFTGK